MNRKNDIEPRLVFPPWKDKLSQDVLYSKDFLKIFFFFTIFTPCPELSGRGKVLESYGWSNPWEEPYKLDEQLKTAADSLGLFTAKKYEDMENALNNAGLKKTLFSEIVNNKICAYTGSDKYKKEHDFIHFFFHIRNSLAHGRFNVIKYNREEIFLFEDIGSRKDKKTKEYPLSARMILKKSTLLKWITIIEGGEKPYKKEV